MSEDGKAFWERTAKRYDLSMMLLGGPLELMLPRVVEEVDGLRRVLELAAGTGLVTEVIAPVVGELDATDYADAMVAQLQARVGQHGNVRARALDVYALDGTDRYDAIVAANVLHLLPDLQGALKAMLGALAPGGRLIVPTYCHDETALSRLTSRVMGLFGFPGQRRLTLDGMVSLLEREGLEIRRAELLPGLLPIGFVSASVRS
ncbi:MAG: class I SAM-dependent methyltransferase [Alphaproteobacteria bacterium]|nr:class I SAM-dependent methyltransferase [Alphaproteobacteria bacterium]MCB9791948.1 class I SAM-dependent methyltransferase [Alphaproteobacteria bacterium]